VIRPASGSGRPRRGLPERARVTGARSDPRPLIEQRLPSRHWARMLCADAAASAEKGRWPRPPVQTQEGQVSGLSGMTARKRRCRPSHGDLLPACGWPAC